MKDKGGGAGVGGRAFRPLCKSDPREKRGKEGGWGGKGLRCRGALRKSLPGWRGAPEQRLSITEVLCQAKWPSSGHPLLPCHAQSLGGNRLGRTGPRQECYSRSQREDATAGGCELTGTPFRSFLTEGKPGRCPSVAATTLLCQGERMYQGGALALVLVS